MLGASTKCVTTKDEGVLLLVLQKPLWVSVLGVVRVLVLRFSLKARRKSRLNEASVELN